MSPPERATDGTDGTDVREAIDVDVAVVGGGMVGRPLALALDAVGLRVALIDRAPGTPAPPPPDALGARCTALAGGTVDWLAARGLWRPEAARAEPIRRVHVSHRGRFGATRIDAAELGRDALGQVVDNAAFVASLDAALAASGVGASTGRASPRCASRRARSGSSSRARTVRDGGARGGRRASARLLVVADGAGSATRALLGIGARSVDHDQVAVLGGVALDADHGGTAHERFTDAGPLALLPRPGRTATFVLCADPSARDALEAMDDAAWLAHLQVALRASARALRRDRPAHGRGARARRGGAHPRPARAAARQRRAAAAPGRGPGLQPRDARRRRGSSRRWAGVGAASVPARCRRRPGHAALLARYERDRRGDRRRTAAATDALARAFRGRAALPGRLRAAGLVGLDLAGPARRAFARASAGL